MDPSLFNFYMTRVFPDALRPYMPIRNHTLPLHANTNYLADLIFPEPGGAVEEGWVNDLRRWQQWECKPGTTAWTTVWNSKGI